ncbi:MAG: hypothetical protein MJ161_05245 [Clostridia bacterium]|nr:hypothetical protein [Clostridia bacterium]
MTTKLAFFDFDGTISVPEYLVEDEIKIGYPTVPSWQDYCNAKGKDAYKTCRPVKPVRRYADKLKAEGAKLYILTGIKSEGEVLAKWEFLKDHYDGYFEDMLMVKTPEEKLGVIKKVAEEEGVLLHECELIEDMYPTLLGVLADGIKATHISQIVAEL